MALVLKDRVKEQSTTTGTGTLTLSGAFDGYQSFSAIGNGNTTYYTIYDPATGDWEVGIGTYTASGTTLSRDTVLASSNSGSLVPFTTGTKEVFCTYPAEKGVWLDSSGNVVQNDYVDLSVTGTATINAAALTTGTVSTTPANSTDIANKQYVDTLVASGITYHTPVKYEVPDTTGNLNATYNNGTGGVGATLTNAGTQTAFTPDGVVAQVGDRVLIYNQTNAAQNGVYTVTTVGSGSTNWVLTRSTDTDSYGLKDPNALGEGDAFFITSGNTGAGETYVCNTSGTITFGTTPINFVQVSSAQIYSAGTGLTLSGTTFSITNTGTAGTYGSASQVPVFTTNGQGQVTSVTNTSIGISASQVTSGTLDVVRGGTGLSSYAVGDIVYASGTGTLAGLADAATGNVLLSGGTNTAPAYGKVGLTTHVSGTLPIANGGTGQTTAQAAINSLAGAVTSGQYLRGNGTNVVMSAIQAADVPTLNQNTTGSAGSVANALTMNNSGTGAASGTTFNGSAAQTISYNTIGASPLAGSSSLTTTGTVTSGTWSASFGAVSGANLTNLTAGNLSGTIPSGVLGNSTAYVGTTAIALNRASANQGLTGITSIAMPGGTSGTITVTPAATAGTTAITIPATSGTLITTGDTGTVTNTMLAGSIANAKLANSSVTINGSAVSLGGSITVTATATNALTIGSYLTGGSYNGSAAVTIAADATSANTASKLVARDASGNFSAGTITASLSGTATTATTANALNTANSYTGVNFTATGSLIVGSSGTYAAGSLYSDSNWGMIIRAKQASPVQAEFLFVNSAGSELARITSAGVLSAATFSGAGTSLTGTASSLSIGGNAATATTATNQSGGTVSATTGAFSGALSMSNNIQFTANSGYGINLNGTDTSMHRIYLDAYWTIFKSHANEGWKFRNNSNTDIFTMSATTGNLTTSGTVTAGTFSGAGTSLTGTAASLTTGYCYNTTQGFNSNWNTDFQNAPAGSTILRGDTSTGSSTGGPGGTWWFQQNMRHTNSSNYWGVQVAWGWEDNANVLKTRNVQGGTFGAWVTYINSNNIGSQSVASATNATNATNLTGTAGTCGYSTAGASIAYTGAGGPQVMGSTTNAAMLSLHRAGAYAVNFGLDTDNVLKVGGWSMGGVAYPIVHTGSSNLVTRAMMYKGSNDGAAVLCGADGAIFLNPNTINNSTTIPASYNGVSAGPITIATGVTVTVSTGANWVIN